MTADEMTTRALEALECFNDPARRDGYFDLYEDDIVLHGYTPEPLTPKSALKAFYEPLFVAFPDCRVDTEETLVEGNRLTMRFRFSGTHLGDFQGLPPSGRTFSVDGITILHFGERRCVARWSVTDFLSLMGQIGALPTPG